MSASDDVWEGIVCMQCLQLLVSEDGDVCGCGHPVYCEDCWKELPKKQRADGAPYFDENTGKVYSGL